MTTGRKPKLDKLDAVLAQTSTSPEDAALFAEMLSLPNDGRYPTLDLTPQQRRQRTLEALVSQLDALARQSGADDLRGCALDRPYEPGSVRRTVDRIAALRALSDRDVPAGVRSAVDRPAHVTTLAHQSPGAARHRRHHRTCRRQQASPGERPADIVERTDGIPLFVEEMTKAVLEAESEGEARRTAAAIPSPALSVPASLHASLMARLDRLGSAKEVAQIGAAIGREFSHALVAAVARKPEAELVSALDRLVAAGLLFQQGAPPHATYLFKHALVQDAAYGTLLRETRRALHARIAEALESQFTEIAENQPELLARHCTEAGLIEKAAHLWGKAGQRSLARSAFSEAAEQLTRALAQIAVLPATPALRQEEIKLQVALITPLMHAKGYAAPETKAAGERARLLIERAEALGEPPEDPLLLFSVLSSSWAANYVAFDGDAMRDLAAQFLALAEKQAETVPLMIGHRLMGMSLMLTGDVAESRAHFDQAIALYDPAKHRALTARFGIDGSVGALLGRAWALWFLGYPEAALRDAESALSVAREIGQAATLMFALGNSIIVQILCGNRDDSSRARARASRTRRRKRRPILERVRCDEPGLCMGPEAARRPEPSNYSSRALPGFGRRVQQNWLPFYFVHLARAHADLGQFEEACARIDEALTAVETTKEKWCEAEVHRTAGEIELMSPSAEHCESGSAFRARLGGCARTAGKVLGAARRDEPGAAVARSGQAERGARTPRSGLRLVHRRLRYARPEGG